MAAPALAAPHSQSDADLIRQIAGVDDPAVFAAETLALLAAEGSTRHAHLQRIAAGGFGTRQREAHADLIHFLSILHGHHPSVAEVAVQRSSGRVAPVVVEWLAAAALTFQGERQWLAGLVVAAPPMSALAGLTAAEQAVRAQHDAMLTLARSDRAGCAFGAALALLFDWNGIHAALAASQAHLHGSDRVSADWRRDMPPATLTRAALEASAGTVALRRALLFGTSQMLMQHRALWDLLEARHASL